MFVRVLICALAAVLTGFVFGARERYLVQPGDSLWRIAHTHDVTIPELRKLNEWNNTKSSIRAWDEIWVPVSERESRLPLVFIQRPKQNVSVPKQAADDLLLEHVGFTVQVPPGSHTPAVQIEPPAPIFRSGADRTGCLSGPVATNSAVKLLNVPRPSPPTRTNHPDVRPKASELTPTVTNRTAVCPKLVTVIPLPAVTNTAAVRSKIADPSPMVTNRTAVDSKTAVLPPAVTNSPTVHTKKSLPSPNATNPDAVRRKTSLSLSVHTNVAVKTPKQAESPWVDPPQSLMSRVYAAAIQKDLRKGKKMRFCRGTFRAGTTNDWPFDSGALERRLAGELSRGTNGVYLLTGPSAAHVKKEPDGRVSCDETIRWLNAELGAWAVKQLDSRYSRCSEEIIRRLMVDFTPEFWKTHACLTESGATDPTPLYPYGWIAAWKVASSFYLVMDTDTKGAWHPRTYRFVMWDGTRAWMVAGFSQLPSRDCARAAMGVLDTPRATNNLAVLLYTREADRFDPSDSYIEELLGKAGRHLLPEALYNQGVYYENKGDPARAKTYYDVARFSEEHP